MNVFLSTAAKEKTTKKSERIGLNGKNNIEKVKMIEYSIYYPFLFKFIQHLRSKTP